MRFSPSLTLFPGRLHRKGRQNLSLRIPFPAFRFCVLIIADFFQLSSVEMFNMAVFFIMKKCSSGRRCLRGNVFRKKQRFFAVLGKFRHILRCDGGFPQKQPSVKTELNKRLLCICHSSIIIRNEQYKQRNSRAKKPCFSFSCALLCP